jgi:opacity protein-like surface antigen
MKIRMIALAGVAAVALAGPASASDATGWYLGLGAGWDHLGQVKELYTPGAHVIKQDTDDSALVVGSVGYRFADRVRLEAEIGWDRHDATGDAMGSGVPAGTSNGGRATITSALFNAAYDIPLASASARPM